jgi:hypothetical protein
MRTCLLSLLLFLPGCQDPNSPAAKSNAKKAALGKPAYVVTVAEFLKEAQTTNAIAMDRKYKGKTIDLIGVFRGFAPKGVAAIFPDGGGKYIFMMDYGIYGLVDPTNEEAFSKLKPMDEICVRFRCADFPPRVPLWTFGPCFLIQDAQAEVKKRLEAEKAEKKRAEEKREAEEKRARDKQKD